MGVIWDTVFGTFSDLKQKREGKYTMTNPATTRHYNCCVELLLMSNEWTTCFPTDKCTFDITEPHISVALSKVIFLLIYC